MDDFKPMGLTEFNRLLEELDSLNQDPQAIFFAFFGTPRDLTSVGKGPQALLREAGRVQDAPLHVRGGGSGDQA